MSEKRYLEFCKTYNCEALPGSELTLAYCAASLTKTLQRTSVRTYMSAVWNLHLELGLPYPDKPAILLTRVMRGISRSDSQQRGRLPITVPLLRELCQRLEAMQLCPKQATMMLKAAFSLTVHGFMRCGELTAGLTRAHIAVDPSGNFLQVRLDRSKTDPCGKGVIITIGASKDLRICPVKAMAVYLSVRPGGVRSLFVPHNGSELTREKVTQELRTLLTACGARNLQEYSSHSFRLGAATPAATAGVPERITHHMGRRRSNTVRQYIRIPQQEVMAVSAQLATTL